MNRKAEIEQACREGRFEDAAEMWVEMKDDRLSETAIPRMIDRGMAINLDRLLSRYRLQRRQKYLEKKYGNRQRTT